MRFGDPSKNGLADFARHFDNGLDWSVSICIRAVFFFEPGPAQMEGCNELSSK